MFGGDLYIVLLDVFKVFYEVDVGVCFLCLKERVENVG